MSTSAAPRSPRGSWTDTALFFARPVALHRDTTPALYWQRWRTSSTNCRRVSTERSSASESVLPAASINPAPWSTSRRIWHGPTFRYARFLKQRQAWPAWWRTTVRRRRGRRRDSARGVGLEHVVMVTVGTGIGGGIVVDGRVLRGAHGVAAGDRSSQCRTERPAVWVRPHRVLGAVRERQRPRARGAGIGGRTATGSDGAS